MRNLSFMTVEHRPASKSLQGKAYKEITYIEIPDSREQDDVLMDLAQEWYRERSELFADTEKVRS